HVDSDYDGHYFHLMAVSGMEWSLKRDMYLNFWFCIKPNYGYNFSSCFYRSSHVITDWDFTGEWLGVTNNQNCYNNTQTEAVLKYTPDPRVKRTQVLWYNRNNQSSADLAAVKKYNPEAATINEGEYKFPFFDGARVYILYMAFFDEDNDLLLTTGYVVQSNLFNADEWEDVGVGKFEPTLFESYLSPNRDRMHYTPDLTSFAPYDVKIIRRKDTPEVIRIVNPFGVGTPFENIDTAYGIFVDESYSEMEIYFYHDQDYFIEIDTREDENGWGTLKANQFSGIYWENWSNPFSGNVVMDNGVIRDKYGSEFILTLPGAKSKDPAIVDISEYDPRPITDVFFSEKYTQESAPSVKIECPANAYRVYAATVSAHNYDPQSTPKDMVAGKVTRTVSMYGYSYGNSTLTVDLQYPDPHWSQVRAGSSDDNSYKIVIVATSSNGDIQGVTAVDHTRATDESVKIGTVTFVDPVLQIYTEYQEITADIYEYKDRPGLFRIDTPWEKSLYPKYPNAFSSGLETPTDLIIDATDPEKVEIIYGCVGYGDPLNEIYMWHALT
ncbi:MAG: hypothetical protein K2L93_06655, partial [Muribaculaceae bacterium]|nr:hypothetical protein [Muribaculaceae bacterium]